MSADIEPGRINRVHVDHTFYVHGRWSSPRRGGNLRSSPRSIVPIVDHRPDVGSGFDRIALVDDAFGNAGNTTVLVLAFSVTQVATSIDLATTVTAASGTPGLAAATALVMFGLTTMAAAGTMSLLSATTGAASAVSATGYMVSKPSDHQYGIRGIDNILPAVPACNFSSCVGNRIPVGL